MKKLITIMLILAFAIIIFAACSPQTTTEITTSQEKPEIVLPAWPQDPTIDLNDNWTFHNSHVLEPGFESIENIIDHLSRDRSHWPYSEFWTPAWTIPTHHAFRGVVISERQERNANFFNALFTITTFEILEVFFGDYNPGDVVDVYQWGGPEREMFVFMESYTFVELPIGEDFIVFTTSFDEVVDGIGVRVPNRMAPITAARSEAFYWVASPDDGRGMSMTSDASVVEEGVIVSHPRNEITLTADHLRELAELGGRSVGGAIR